MNSSAPTQPNAPGISFDDIFRYLEQETARWRTWFAARPAEVLSVPMGTGADEQIGTVGAMLFHIFVVEWVYAQRLHDLPLEGWKAFKHESLDEIFAVHDEARAGLRKAIDHLSDASLEQTATLSGRGMTLTGTRRKFLIHTFVHSTRHWAQVATALRQHGYKTDWQHDLILSDAIR